MSLQRIAESLKDLFVSHAIVFWDDSEGEFLSTVDNLVLDKVHVVRLQETPALQIKIDIERQPDQQFLFYSTNQNPTLTMIGCWIFGCAVNHLKPILHLSCWMIWVWFRKPYADT